MILDSAGVSSFFGNGVLYKNKLLLDCLRSHPFSTLRNIVSKRETLCRNTKDRKSARWLNFCSASSQSPIACFKEASC